MSPRGRATAFDIRETLDEAVRDLAISPRPLHDRVCASSMVILDRLSPTDFAFSEDRELLNKIQEAFADASCTGDGDRSNAVTGQTSGAIAEEIAADILDLRDTAMGRAIRDARMTRLAERSGRSRR